MTINVAVVEATADTMVLVDGIWVVLKIIFFWGTGDVWFERKLWIFELEDAGNWGCLVERKMKDW